MTRITEANYLAWVIVSNLERNQIISAIVGLVHCEPSTVCGRIKQKVMFEDMVDTYNLATHVIKECALW
jgi:hypothetical protein